MDDETDPRIRAVYQPVSDLNAEHIQMFGALQDALRRSDLEGCRKAMRRIRDIEEESKNVHAAARAAALEHLRPRV